MNKTNLLYFFAYGDSHVLHAIPLKGYMQWPVWENYFSCHAPRQAYELGH